MSLGSIARTVLGRVYSWVRRSPREWYWVVRRRLSPQRPFCFTFDETLRIEVCLGDELGISYALGKEFEPDICAFLRRFLRQGMVVFDVGANIGQFTLLAAKRVGEAGSVHAFEPSPEEAKKLEQNILLNGLRNVTVRREAVLDHEGNTTFHLAGPGLGLYNSVARPIRWTDEATLQVPCTTLDGYVALAGIARLDLIKMDIEGAELAALAGAKGCLSRISPVVICEFSDATASGLGHSTTDLRRFLESMGYRLYRYDARKAVLVPEDARDRYDYANLICCQDARLAGVLSRLAETHGESRPDPSGEPGG